KPQIVSMEGILNSKRFKETSMELPIALGKTITNEVFMVDLAKIPHLLVAGATGQGKSVGLNAIITSLLYKKHPNELKFVLIDPKKVEFSIYTPIVNHFMAQIPTENEDEEAIITDVTKVIRTLNSLCKLMDHRYDLLKMAGTRNVKEYNKKYVEHKLRLTDGHEYMPYIVVIIDEFGDLIMTAGKEIELPIARIAQLARAVGIHMVIATQRPTTKIITGNIKANFPGRIAFKTSARIDSMTILDQTGANQLIGRGDMLFVNGNDPIRVQCAFVDTPEVERINQYIKEQPGPLEPLELPEPSTDETGGGGSSVDVHNLDPLFEEAAHAIVISQQGSTSMIQRRFSIGYNRAGRLMDQLQEAGIVGEAMGSKPREVLITDINSLDSLLASLRR
ncbi:MAG: DNA translocase FtsK, partial [Prevotella sp.]|nr:DNA translocase FtsK [Prevotella sp.]